ncbi:Protein NUCLEAR FUSION DEFECTIVE 4, partial [Bienertia sinuspersici]
GNSICWINTVSYLVALHSFPYLGLTAVIYTPAVMRSLLSPLILLKKPKKVEHGFLVILMITIATGIYAVASSLGPISRSPPWFKLIGLGICLTAPLPTGKDEYDVDNWVKDQDTDATGGKHAMENIDVKSMMMRLNFWRYFVYSGATLGLVYLNNLGQIAESRGVSRTSVLVSLASAMIFFGHLLPSVLEYAYSRDNSMVPGPALIVAAMVPMAAVFFLLMINESNLLLHASTPTIGFSTGITAALCVSTSELFGPKRFRVKYNIIVANVPLGSFLFGGLAALLYHKEGDRHGKCWVCSVTYFIFVLVHSICRDRNALTFDGKLLATTPLTNPDPTTFGGAVGVGSWRQQTPWECW